MARGRTAAVCLFLAATISLPVFLSTGVHSQEIQTTIVSKDVRMEINIYGVYQGTIALSGPSALLWSVPHFNGDRFVTDMQIMTLDLAGSTQGADDIHITLNPLPPSLGHALSLSPGEPCPAESFFDVFMSVSLEAFPGMLLHNVDPVHLSATIEAIPPYFERYETSPSEVVLLYNDIDEVKGEITYWRDEAIPTSPPEAHVWAETSKGSDVAIPVENNVVVHAATSCSARPSSATFSWRMSGSPEPFAPFWTDYDGQAPAFSTHGPLGSGDGWTGYLDVNIFPPTGVPCDIEVRFTIPPGFEIADTSVVFVDPTPPIPGAISIAPDSIGYFKPDSLHPVTCVTQDENPTVVWMKVFPLATERHRELNPVDQYGLDLGDPDVDSMACAPAAGASCLDYWSGNGYPGIDYPGGSASCRASSSMENNAQELAGRMGTNADEGTYPDQMVSGIKSFLDSRGMSGWQVEHQKVDGSEDIAAMCSEFEAEGEDVMILVEGTDANGDTVGHVVTMGSKGASTYEIVTEEYSALCVSHRVDFMDPAGGGTTQNNEYNVDYDSEGRPALQGYDLGGGDDAHIVGFVKVSPPEGSGGKAASISVRRAPAEQAWITVSTVPAKGMGLVDTLSWDTTGFPGGLYLLAIGVVDADGREGRAMRLCGIPEWTVGTDEPATPGMKLDLRSPYPNPFNPATTIEFTIPADAQVALSIYDISGRMVRRLCADEPMRAGSHRMVWDGRNSAGRPVASGTYFCRLRAGDKCRA